MKSLKAMLTEIIQESTIPPVFRKLFKEFPTDASSWKYATDEMRDITRTARELYNQVEHDFTEDDENNPKYIKSMNFRNFKTPSEWNTKSQNEIVRIWNLMGNEAKRHFLDYLKRDYPKYF